jgi:membrane protein implicated in regulation of membrane protease activity
MDLWVLFVIVGCLLAAGEILNTSFFLAPFAVAALLAAAVDGAGGPPAASITTFVVASVALFVFVRPIARRHVQMPALSRTGTDALIGQRALVLEEISNLEGVGTVKIGGEIWTARAADDDHQIAAGARVQVVEIRGATALVSEL